MSVYFAKVGRYIKVGYSTNPERRVANLWKSGTRYGRPWDLDLVTPELLLVLPGHKDVEHRCHVALADYSAMCEFFIDEPGVREFMVRAERGDFTPVERPGGEFEPVGYEAASPERVAEFDAWVAKRVARIKARRAVA